MLIASSLYLALRCSMSLQETASIKFAGMRLETGLPLIGKAFGTPLSASNNTAGEIITVSLNQVSLKDVMDRIATTFDGSWKPEGRGFVFNRSSDETREFKKKEFALRVEAISKRLVEKKKALEKLQPWSTKESETLLNEYRQFIKAFNPTNYWMKSSELERRGPSASAFMAAAGGASRGTLSQAASAAQTTAATAWRIIGEGS